MRMKQKLLSILALLLVAVTGAWADESSESFTTNSGASSYTGEHFKISLDDKGDGDGFYLSEDYNASIEALNGEIITKVEFTVGYYDITRLHSGVGTTTYKDGVATVSGVNATSLTVNATDALQIKAVKVYYTPPVAITGITLSQTAASMTVGGDALTLTATVAPDNATDKTVTWTTSDANVATVTDGVVTAVAAGTATITATATNGTAVTSDDKTATCTVTVSPAKYAVTLKDGTEDADNWTISPATAEEGQTVTITYTGSKRVKSVTAVKKAAGTPLDNTTTAWTAGTFAVPAGGLTYSDAITVSGDVTLTLTDGETLTLNKGISLASGATLTIQGNGAMVVNGTSGSTASTVAGSTGTLILTSGTLTATGGNGQDMTGTMEKGASGGAAINGSVTVNGGSLTANGGNGGNCNGNRMEDTHGGAGGAAISGDVTITDGAVAATGGNGGSISASRYGSQLYGGAGGAAIGGNATLTGGTLKATQGANGTETGTRNSSVGAGGKAVAGTVTNNGGTVN